MTHLIRVSGFPTLSDWMAICVLLNSDHKPITEYDTHARGFNESPIHANRQLLGEFSRLVWLLAAKVLRTTNRSSTHTNYHPLQNHPLPLPSCPKCAYNLVIELTISTNCPKTQPQFWVVIKFKQWQACVSCRYTSLCTPFECGTVCDLVYSTT